MPTLKRSAKPLPESTQTFDWRQKDRHYNRCPTCQRFKLKRKMRCRACLYPRSPEMLDIFYVDGEPCRYLSLTKGLYAIVDAGLFAKLAQWKWCANYANRRDKEGKPVFYACHRVKGRNVFLHRAIVKTSAKDIDHKNGNPLDNRKSNLTPCTRSQNLIKKRVDKPTISGFRGVHFHKASGLFRVDIQCKGVTYCFGYFRDPKEGARKYNAEALRLNGEFAVLNHIND